MGKAGQRKNNVKIFLFQVQTLTFFGLLLILGLQAQFSETLWGPALSEKPIVQSEICDLWSHNSLVQHDMFPNFFLLQKSLHPGG